jgi:hypothetical protein
MARPRQCNARGRAVHRKATAVLPGGQRTKSAAAKIRDRGPSSRQGLAKPLRLARLSCPFCLFEYTIDDMIEGLVLGGGTTYIETTTEIGLFI